MATHYMHGQYSHVWVCVHARVVLVKVVPNNAYRWGLIDVWLFIIQICMKNFMKSDAAYCVMIQYCFKLAKLSDWELFTLDDFAVGVNNSHLRAP